MPGPSADRVVGCRKQSGASLLEVLIALLILSIGLLGLAGLQAASLRHTHEAQLRSQATWLAMDMLERMRANQQELDAYTGTHANVPCMGSTGQGALATAVSDALEWQQNLGCLLPLGSSVVTRSGDTVTVEISWAVRANSDDAPADADEAGLQTFSLSTRL